MFCQFGGTPFLFDEGALLYDAMDTQKKHSIVFFIIIFFFGFVFGMGVSRFVFDNGQPRDDTAGGKIGQEEKYVPYNNSISVGDQEAGDSVFVSLATLARSAWIAVHEDRGGSPGNILGARYFPGGKTAGAIDLLRGTSPGALYYAIVHTDDGDRQFDFRNDTPLEDSFGNTVMTTFETFPQPE
ncbi:MAG: hypothetical protein HY445_02635 [Candidatus Niyogibacteria bacterium]|nr:hypothetical protein [Candidatus Niyogibacteria bacterium]